MNIVYSVTALLLVVCACGPSYPRGKTSRTADETVFYYPDPELPADDATLTSLKGSEEASKCAAALNEGSLGLICGEVTYGFAPNPDNKKVLIVSCLGKITDAQCEATIKKIIAGRK